SIDRLEQLDLLSAIRSVQLLELSRFYEDIAFEGPNSEVVRVEARLQPAAQRIEMTAERPDRFVQIAAQLADFSCVFPHPLLLPPVGDSSQQCDQSGWTCGNDVLIDAELDE